MGYTGPLVGDGEGDPLGYDPKDDRRDETQSADRPAVDMRERVVDQAELDSGNE